MEDIIKDLRDVRASRTDSKLIRPIIPIEEWVYSEYYVGPDASSVYEFWRKHLIAIFSSKRKPEEYIDQILIDGCFIGSTRIPMLDGSIHTIKELAEGNFYSKYVYSVDINTGNIVPGRLIDAFKTKSNVEVWRLELDDGTVFYATKNHKMLKRDCTYVELQNLKPGDALYPFYRKDGIANTNNDNDYEYVYDVTEDKYILTHHMVAKHFGFPYENGYVIHHKDENKRNNSPENLEKKTAYQHKRDHALDRFYNHGGRELWIENVIRNNKSEKSINNLKNFYANTEKGKEYKRQFSENRGRYNRENNEYLHKRRSESVRSTNKEYFNSFGVGVDQIKEAFLICNNWNEFVEYFEKNYNVIFKRFKSKSSMLNAFDIEEFSGYKKTRDKLLNEYKNHKVVSVSFSHYEDVYDLTVQDYHNFMVCSTNNSGICVSNSIGGGKTTFSNLCMMRKLYELSCYENMQSLFNLMLSSKIAFTYFNITKDQAEETGFGQLREMIDSSPYFQEHFLRNTRTDSVIEWPDKKLSVGFGSGTSSMIGGNLLGSILDEANFYQGDGKDAVAGQVQSKASKMYTSIRNRGRSRFLKNGINHALNIVVSSSMYANSFMNKLKQDCVGDPHTYYIETKIWDVKPEGTYSKERFWVFKGADNLDPSLCDSINQLSDITEVLGYGRFDENFTVNEAINTLPIEARSQYFIDIPVDFRKSFDDNLIQALQDIAGVSVAPSGRLFSSRYHYNLALDTSIEFPLIAPEVTLSTKSEVTWKDLFKPSYKFVKPEKPRFIHFDQSYAGDKTGISCCYIDEVVETEEGSIPHIKFDFMFTIVPPKPPAQTAIYKLRELIPFLAHNYNLTFGKITYDMFASIESMQILQSQGYPVVYQSVDRTDEAYLAFCNLMYEERVKFPYSREFEENIFNVVHYRSKHKVDHLADGGKDVSDSAVGAAFNALTSESIEQTLRSNDAESWIEYMS